MIEKATQALQVNNRFVELHNKLIGGVNSIPMILAKDSDDRLTHIIGT